MASDVAGALLATALPPFPYPGLRPFEADEWRIFFGRESMVNDIIERMAGQHLVFIHGASGSGKSSLVRAGVLPKLAQLHALHGIGWVDCKLRPAGGPLWNLAAELARLDGCPDDLERIGEIIRMFNRRDASLSAVIDELPALQGRKLCILVDQFEELFRYEQEISRDEAEQFIDLLIGEIPEDAPMPDDDDDPGTPPPAADRIQIIVTMRSEFLGDCARFDRFAEAINRAQYLVPRLTRPALLRAIRMPARLYGGEIKLELAERLIAEVRGKPDELPLIQHGLMYFWNEAIESDPGAPVILEPTLLDQAGGLRELLSLHADRVMQRIATDPSRQAAVQLLFRAITDINAEGQAIRRPQRFRDLVALCGVPAADLHAIIDAFRAEGASFLTPYMPAKITDETDIDISHEALIRCWQTLGLWMRAEAGAAELYRGLRLQAQLRQPLLTGNDLDTALAWRRELNPSPLWARRYSAKADDSFDVTMTYLAASETRAQRLDARRRRIARFKTVISTTGLIGFASAVVVAIVWVAYGQGFYVGYANGRGDTDFSGHNGKPNYLEALRWYEKAAAFGNPHAEDRLGAIYQTGGYGVQPDARSAMVWYLKAAGQGVVDAELRAAENEAAGLGCTQDYGKAMQLFQKAAAAGSAEADDQIGLLYTNGEGVTQNFSTGLAWFKRAAAAGWTAASTNIAILYLNGDGVPADDGQALSWFMKAAGEAKPDAEYDIAMLYINGQGVNQDYTRALAWFRRAAADGSLDAERKIGSIYFFGGHGVTQDLGAALNWYRKAIANGSAEAEWNLAFMYLNGQGVKQDFGQAMTLFKQAAQGGASDAADADYQVGLLYQNGQGMAAPNNAAALDWFEKAAAAGSADAEDALGEIYVNGQGVAIDYGLALGWFQKAAAGGSSEAEYHIGRRYLNGQGVAQNYATALNWFQKGAADGCADAQNAIGLLYLNGQGVKEDDAQAMTWFKKAAANGSADAEYHIGFRYFNGDAVKQDYGMALTWFTRAAADGSADAEYQLAEIYLNGNGVAKDDTQALGWFQKAVADGATNAADAAASIGMLYLNGTGGIKQNTGAARAAFAQALGIEQTNLASDPGDSEALGDLSWYLLLNNQPAQALKIANQALAIAPTDLLLEGNKADALMLLGQTAAARALYLQYKKVPDSGNGTSWQGNVLSDFDTLRKLGDANPLMTEITKDFSN